MDTVNSREIYANPWMTLREDAVRFPDGTDGVYGVVDKPDYALVIPLDGDRVCLVEQYRYPLQTRRWEFPQGTAPDRAEMEPDALAARELAEETGVRARHMARLGTLDVAPGLSNQRGTVFLATGLTPGAPARETTEQDMRSGWFGRAEFERMIVDGTVADAQSVAAYTLLLLTERAEEVPGS